MKTSQYFMIIALLLQITANTADDSVKLGWRILSTICIAIILYKHKDPS